MELRSELGTHRRTTETTTPVEPLPNVALMKQAAQSSTEMHARASNAVSGCRSGFGDGCCTHTSMQSNPWWIVDLLAVHKVSAVLIINRQDCCSERLLGAQILIGNSPEINDKNLRCGTISSVQNMSTHTFQCGDIEGRYVTVVIPGEDKILTLCEVEVYASLAEPEAFPPPPPPPPPPPTESMQLSGRTVTVVGDRLCWSDALFYCRHHHWDLLSLRSEEEQSAVEQLLSRSPFPLTDFVWLGLRRYIMRNTWFWMSGDSMKFSKWSYSSAPFHCSYSYYPCGGMAKGERHLWEDQPCEELLNFICESRAEDGAQRVSFNSTRKVLSGD
uniref:C-type lectin domain-containing protein n=1 Tax=Dicentrarchus labrax TaxID=13489 RepID=A0A8P4KK98_DICLA